MPIQSIYVFRAVFRTFSKAVKVGEGSYGEVFKLKLDGRLCVVKVRCLEECLETG